MLVLGVPHQWNLPLLSSVGSMESGCQDVTRLVGMSLGSWQQGSECSFIILPHLQSARSCCQLTTKIMQPGLPRWLAAFGSFSRRLPCQLLCKLPD